MAKRQHALIRYMEQIEKTHRGVGRLFSFALMAQKARKAVIVIGVAGTGKTLGIKSAAKYNPEGMISKDAVTRSGLQSIEKELTGYKGCFIVEDLGGIDTSYSAKESIKVGVTLAHEHHLSKMNASMNIDIHDFEGSFMTTAQPIVMQQLVNSSDWEAVVRDKTIRYYHMLRPVSPTKNPIDIKVKWGTDFEEVSRFIPKSAKLNALIDVGLDQWGMARANEHIEDMLKACAALDGRTRVNNTDIDVCLELTRPMRMEKYLIEKEGFESEKTFLNDHACMMTEFATYKTLTYQMLQTNYKITRRVVNKILRNVHILWLPDPKNDNRLYPSQECADILKECGYL